MNTCACGKDKNGRSLTGISLNDPFDDSGSETLDQNDQWENSLVNVSGFIRGGIRARVWETVKCEVDRESVSGRGGLNESFVSHAQRSNCALATV